MAQIDDNDLEMLEAFLDQELTDVQRNQLRRRLESEPALAAELETLRRDRETRQTIFKGFEGGEQAVVDRAMTAIGDLERRRAARTIRLRRAIYAFAAAACIIVGFLFGWMGAMGGKSTVKAVEPTYRVELLDESGQTLAVQKFHTLETAREFSSDVQQWQDRQERFLSGRVTRRSDRY